MTTLIAAFLDRAKADPTHPSLIVEGVAVSAEALLQRMLRTAAQLHEAGVRPGDRVGLWLDNGLSMVAALMAVQYLGAVGMALSPTLRAPKLAAILSKTEASALLTDAAMSRSPPGRLLRTSMQETCCRWLDVDELPSTHAMANTSTEPAAPYAGGHEGTLAMIAHTSGSSGEPKGVMLSRRNLVWVCETIANYLELGPGTRIGCALPLSFNYGQTHLWMSLARGSTLVLDRGFQFPPVLIERWASTGVELLPLVPAHLAMLLMQPRFDSTTLPSLRTVTTAAAALSAELHAVLRDHFPGIRVLPMYGQTECTRISFLPADAPDEERNGLGCGLPGQRHWLEDEAGRIVDGAGQGELIVSGPHVMLGYWRGPERRPRLDPDTGERCLHTGDWFERSVTGNLRFLSRRDEIIKCGGEKVAPQEVEDALRAQPGVAACAVRGVAHPLLGEAVHAWVVAAKGAVLDPSTLMRQAARQLEPAAWPRGITLVDALPMSDRGKVLKRLLPDPPSNPEK